MLFKFRKLHFGELKGVKGSYRPSAWEVKGTIDLSKEIIQGKDIRLLTPRAVHRPR